MKLFPPIKVSTGNNNYYPLKNFITTDEFEFEPTISAFVDYIDRIYCVRFVSGNDGITVRKDKSLRENEYTVKSYSGNVIITAGNIESLNRAFSTVIQMIKSDKNTVKFPNVNISDNPDFSWRAIMVDLARQWHPVSYIYKYIDICWLYKINVLQLHFSDDQSYTLPSEKFPQLPTLYKAYTKTEIDGICEYANNRGVLIVPEVDMPGHSKQFTTKYPTLFGNQGVITADKKSLESIHMIIDEVISLFPHSRFIHLGGDEASVNEWKNCSRTIKFIEQNNITDLQQLYAYFLGDVTSYVVNKGKIPVVWEGFTKEFNSLIPKETYIEVFESYYQTAPELLEDGFSVINSSWKPLYIVTPDTHWTPDEIADWNPYIWRHWWSQSKAYEKDIVVPKTSNVAGGTLCAWGDKIKDFSSCEDACAQELALIVERVPAFSASTWNITKSGRYVSGAGMKRILKRIYSY